MKNRIASLFLVFAMLMSLCNFAVARDNRITVQSGGAEKFTDVPTGHWAYAYINKVVGSGLFNGRTETTFEPSNAMTRSQFVMVMARMEGMGSLEGQTTQTKFPDVSPTRRAAGPIAWATEQGFVQGFGDGTFKPDSPITRGQFAALIHRYIIAKRYTNLRVLSPEPAQFADIDSVPAVFKEDVEYARVHGLTEGLLQGYSDGTVRASNPITRAAIAAILARFLDLVTESGYTPLLDGPTGNGDNGDSGDSGNTEPTPVDVPTSYKQIKLNVTNTKHGTTTFLSVLRNGAQVASDDVQPGDKVTISHVPESGYRVKITVKDSKGKEVPVTTNGNTSTFVAPENLPVTITLKYLKESTSGGSGSGGSSSGSGSGSGTGTGTGGQPITQTTHYYLTVNATAGTGGSVYLTTTPPTANAVIPSAASAANSAVGATASYTFDRANASGSIVIGYAVFVPNEDYTFEGATASTGVTLTPAQAPYTSNTVSMKRSSAADAPSVNVTYIQITANGTTTQTAPAIVSVNGTFTGGGTDNPPTTTTYTWTVNVTNGDYANYRLVETNPASPTAFTTATKDGKIELKDIPANTEKQVYLVVSPESGYKFGDVELDVAGSAKLERVYPATAAETDTVRVYEITRTIAANTTTGVSILMQVADGVGKTHNVNVKSFLGTTELTEKDTTVPVRASVDMPTATLLNKVTVKIPVIKTPGGYDFDSIKVTNASGTDISESVKLKPETSDASNVSYSFIMPDYDVVVNVTYKEVANSELTYDVTVNVNGSGSVSVNIAGLTFTTDTRTNYHVTMDGETVSVIEGNGTVTKMKETQYLALYPGRTDYKLPVYLTATPVAAKGFKYSGVTSTPSNVVVKSDSMTEAQQFVLENGTPLVITATFTEITSYGYNLTVIGPGSVSVRFNGSTEHYGDDTDLPKTYSSGLVEDSASTLTLNKPGTRDIPSGYEVADKLIVNGKQQDYGTVNLTKNTLDEIIVDIHNAARKPKLFSVSLASAGSVTIKSENGAIIDATAGNFNDNSSDAVLKPFKDSLDAAALGTSKTLTRGTTDTSAVRWYCAYEGSIITIDPASVVKSINVYNGSANLTDILSTKGFSFQLTNNATRATVDFGTFQSYTVRAQVGPANGSLSDISVNSTSTGISNSSRTTIAAVLNSLNDGQRLKTGRNSTTNITNAFYSPPVQLNRTLSYYLTHEVASKKDSTDKQTGNDALKAMLEDTIKSNIADIIPSMIEKQKKELKDNPSTVTDPLKTEMETQQRDADKSVTIGGTVKSDIIGQILNTDQNRYAVDANGVLSVDSDGKTLKELYDAGTITQKDFDITAIVTPILSKAKADEIKAANASLDLTGKSAQEQLERFAQDYLDKLQITNGNNLQPEVSVTTQDITVKSDDPAIPDYAYPEITVSAKVGLGDNGAWPALDTEHSVKMASYANQLTVWVLAQISGISVKGYTVRNLNVAPALYNSSQFSSDTSAQSVRNALTAVDEAIEGTPTKEGTWTTKLNNDLLKPDRTDGNKLKLFIDMNKVLTKELLDAAVEDAIQGPSNTLVDKVNSLGNGDATRAAFMNLYRDFVLFENNKLYLKSRNYDATKTDNAANLCEIGSVEEDLVLSLDFEKILRDVDPPADNTSFEKLTDLVMALRNGISADIRSTAKSNKASQAVIASLIEGQIRSNRGTMTAYKWDTTIGNGGTRPMTDAERKELSNLLAALLMDSETTDSMKTAWQSFEDSGYQSVEFNITVDAAKRAGIGGLIESYFKGYNPTSEQTKLNVGFSIAELIG